MAEFLPISKSDMKRRGWAQCDFVYIIGDAYVDHPSFGHAIISRVLESHGYKVGIISHVEALRENILQGIEVVKGKAGSRVRLHV